MSTARDESARPGVGSTWDDLLRGIIALVSEEGDLRALLRGAARLAVKLTSADACFVHVLDRERAEVVLLGATPDRFDSVAGTVRLRLGEGVAGWVAQHGRPALIHDKWNDARYRYIPALRGEEYKSLVSVPMMRPNRGVVGVLNLHAHGAEHFDEDAVRQLQDVAGLLSGVVDAALLHARLRRREAELEDFARRSLELQELDRRRIAGDIHDGVSQRLVSAWYHLRAAIGVVAEPAGSDLERAAGLLSEALDDSRRAIAGLRPTLLDDLGFAAAVASLASELRDVEMIVAIDHVVLAPHVETALFRIIQESLQNVVKHAQATTVEITLRSERTGVVLAIADDGVGFDSPPGEAAGHFGLAGMHERAELLGGTLSVRSNPGDGTLVRLHVPAERHGADRAGDS